MKKVNSDKIDKNCVSLWPSTKLFTAQCRSTDQGLGIPAVEYLYFSVLIFFYNPWMCVQTKYFCFSLFVNNFTSCLQWFAICPQWHHLSDPPNCRGCNPQWTFIYPLFSSTLTVFYYTRPRKYISRDEQTDSPPCLPHPFLTPHCPPLLSSAWVRTTYYSALSSRPTSHAESTGGVGSECALGGWQHYWILKFALHSFVTVI